MDTSHRELSPHETQLRLPGLKTSDLKKQVCAHAVWRLLSAPLHMAFLTRAVRSDAALRLPEASVCVS